MLRPKKQRRGAVGTTTCSKCRSVNQTGGIACVNCGELLVDPESVERRTRGRSTPSAGITQATDPPAGIEPSADPSGGVASTQDLSQTQRTTNQPSPPPPMPVLSDAPVAETPLLPPRPEPPRKRIGLAIAIAISAVALVAVFALVVTKYKGTGFPDSLAGQPRQTSDAAKQFEQTVASTKIQGVSFEAATYGTGSEPQEILMLFHGLPSSVQQMSRDQFFSGFGASVANGLAGADGGQGVDLGAAAQASVDGVDHECAPISGTSGTGPGVLCLFRGKTVGMLLLRNYADPQAALSVSEEAARAVN
jgi:hypothetical protein